MSGCSLISGIRLSYLKNSFFLIRRLAIIFKKIIKIWVSYSIIAMLFLVFVPIFLKVPLAINVYVSVIIILFYSSKWSIVYLGLFRPKQWWKQRVDPDQIRAHWITVTTHQKRAQSGLRSRNVELRKKSMMVGWLANTKDYLSVSLSQL